MSHYVPAVIIACFGVLTACRACYFEFSQDSKELRIFFRLVVVAETISLFLITMSLIVSAGMRIPAP